MHLLQMVGRYVVERFEDGDREPANTAFALAERVFTAGPPDDRGAIRYGLLEEIQNVSSHRMFGANAFLPLLGPVTAAQWHELNEEWAGKRSLAEVVASEHGKKPPRWWEWPPWKWWRWRTRRRIGPDDVQDPELRKIVESMTRKQ